MEKHNNKPAGAGLKMLMLVIPMVLVLGYGAGYMYGLRTLGHVYRSTPAPVLLFYRPSIEHLNTMNILNDEDDEKRIAGYYALLDMGTMDLALLKERYEKEDSLFIKRTIVWMIGYSSSKRRAVGVLTEMYRTSPMSLKKEIVRSLRRIDRNYFDEFIKNHGVSKSMIDTIDGRPCQINLTF